MTTGQINYFMTVADEKSFSKAAKRLSVSQPAVSKTVAQLEKKLGFLLFERNSKTVALTQNGETIYGLLKQFTDGFRKLTNKMRNG